MRDVKLTCAQCSTENHVTELSAHEGGFAYTCARCGHLNLMTLGDTSAAPKPTHTVDVETHNLSASAAQHPDPVVKTEAKSEPLSYQHCPKCAYENSLSAKACHRCGLNFAFASSSGRNFKDDGLSNHPRGDHIRTVWADVSKRPEDQKAHEAFIQICTTLNALEYAGARYRTLADANPENEHIAQYRNRVIQAALARSVHLETRVRSGLSDRLRSLLVLCFGALLLLAFAFGYYLLTGNHHFWQDH